MSRKSLPTNLSNLKSKVDKFDIAKLETTPIDLGKLSNVGKNEIVKKIEYNPKTKNIEDKIPNITFLATKTFLNTKINEFKAEIPIITNLATNTAFTVVENKIPNVSDLVKKLTMTQKLMKLKRKLLIIVMINTLLLQNWIS